MKGLAARRLALEVLLKVEIDKAYAKLALNAAFERKLLSERDRAFTTHLVQGVLRHQAELDAALGKLAKQPLAKMPPALKNTLRLAAFQLLYCKEIPVSAVLNTACQIARDTGHAGSAKFVNGVMRAFSKQEQSSSEPAPDAQTESLAEYFSLPEWLIRRWQSNWGKDAAHELMKHSQTIPALTLRCSQLAITPEGLEQIFTTKGIKVKRGELVDSCLTIVDRGKHSGPVSKLPGFPEGLFAVQDEAAAFVAVAADPKPGQIVIDLCAAPGGKTLHLAEIMENKGKITAVDINARRLGMLVQERRRLGLTNIEILEGDGKTIKTDTLCDLVLIDAPCSGTGVINRRSDLRHTRQEPDIAALIEIQRQLLDNAVNLLKPAGAIVYSTCSIEPQENKENIEWFLAKHQDFQLDSLTRFIPENTARNWQAISATDEMEMLQLLPNKHGLSGFFICRLIRA